MWSSITEPDQIYEYGLSMCEQVVRILRKIEWLIVDTAVAVIVEFAGSS